MTPTPVVLRGVSRRFGATTALDGVSWAPRCGEVTALVGLNGAGKSTLMRVMTGLVAPTSGAVTVTAPPGARPVAALIEGPALFTGLSVRRNLSVARILTAADAGEVREIAALVGVTDVLGRRVATLSQGYRQRVAIAGALLGRPRMVLLDEPANALDPEAVVGLRRLIRAVADRGVAMVVSSHLLRELEGTADTLTVLHEGRVRYDGPAAAFAGSHRLRIRAADAAAHDVLAHLLRRAGVPAEPDGEQVWSTVPSAGGADALARRAFAAASDGGIDLVELTHVHRSLEEAFHAAVAPEPAPAPDRTSADVPGTTEGVRS